MLRICSALVLLFLCTPVWAGFGGKIRVIDGDTLDVGGTRVRLHGIDAVETDQTCISPGGTQWNCGTWVSREVRARYQDRMAQCDKVTIDVYGRVVATCFVDGRDIGRDLVSDGLALAYRKYSMAYDRAEKQAAISRVGLHAGQMMRPDAYRKTRIRGDAPERGTCVIKGNIARDGEKIFHLPGQRFYAKTSIRKAKGERWFCSEAEARQAGWRKARL